MRKGFPDYPIDRIEYADVIKGLPVEKESAAGIYCSHVLEHLPLDGFRATLRNVFAYLKPGGTFRFVLPDLEYYIRMYLNQADSSAAMKFMEATHLGEKQIPKQPDSVLRLIFGLSRHLWMWDYKAIEPELKAAGFVEIRRAYFGDSSDRRFDEIESPVRWENCLGVECRKPAAVK